MVLISNNSYEELRRILNDVLYNTIKWFQINQLLSMKNTKIVIFIPANSSNSSLWINHGENLHVITNIINFLRLKLES
jgi:hypothetical protein